MQTLPKGSFINIESEGHVEALKSTARLLAEHTEKMVKEEVDAPSLEALTNNLWQKAAYVTRETERRALQQIFAENFIERFRQLRPAATPLEDLVSELLSTETAFTTEHLVTTASPQENQAPVEVVPTAESAPLVSPEQDEFLGIVKTDEPGEISAELLMAAEREETVTEIAETLPASAPIGEQILPADDNSELLVQTSFSAPEDAANGETVEKAEVADQPVTAKVAAEQSLPSADQPVKSEPAAKTNDQEPFEFGKCTVSLHLRLLPGAGNSGIRKVIISTMSHNLPPEIELLEIAEGENTEQIAGLVKGKLERFRQTLPVKYIEQLRTAKNKTVKTVPGGKIVAAAEKVPGGEEQKAETQNNSGSDQTTASSASVNVPPTALSGQAQPSLF